MKSAMHAVISAFMFCTYIFIGSTNPSNNPKIDDLNKSGYAFTVKVSKINSKYSEMASTVFRDKLIIVSSKKIGGLGNGIDQRTQEPYTDLFCMDINQDRELSYPILFSRILNTKANEGHVAFSKDENIVYYTRSTRENSANYKLYMAVLEEGSYGNWTNHIELAVSSDDYSVENPHMSSSGDYIYFSSNMQGGFGGFDLYRAKVYEDGSLGQPENLGNSINTNEDEKYPHTSYNDEELYFSSKGHKAIGGFDIFIANKFKDNYSNTRNLGITINSEKDEISFLFIDKNTGVFSSNKDNNTGSYNLYHFQSEAIYQDLEGIVINEDGKILPNATVVLLDNEGNELERQIIGADASYNFRIKAFHNYQLKAVKDGFKDYVKELKTENVNTDIAFKAILKLSSKVSFNKMN